MTSGVFLDAARDVRQKRRSFSKDIDTFLKAVQDEPKITLNEFYEKSDQFEHMWSEVVKATEGCIKLIDDSDELADEKKGGFIRGA